MTEAQTIIYQNSLLHPSIKFDSKLTDKGVVQWIWIFSPINEDIFVRIEREKEEEKKEMEVRRKRKRRRRRKREVSDENYGELFISVSRYGVKQFLFLTPLAFLIKNTHTKFGYSIFYTEKLVETWSNRTTVIVG